MKKFTTKLKLRIVQVALVCTIVPAVAVLALSNSFNVFSDAAEVVFDQSSLKRPASSETYITSLDQFDNFLGFDYTGKLKQIYNTENQYMSNGSIFISAQKKYTINPTFDYNSGDQRKNTYSAQYSGGKLMLKEKFQFGHLQIRAKVPNVPGTLPAFWLINNEPHEGYAEIDLMETPGSEKQNAYAAAHWGPTQWETKNTWGMRKMPTLTSAYHWYDLYRFPDRIVMLYDGVKVLDFNPQVSKLANGKVPLNDPMSVYLNFNIGDKWSGQMDDKQLPSAIEIKEMSIRHYR
jgi:beta-glucanase (GH16 family)